MLRRLNSATLHSIILIAFLSASYAQNPGGIKYTNGAGVNVLFEDDNNISARKNGELVKIETTKKKGQSQSFQKASISKRSPSVSNPFHLKKKLFHDGGVPNVMGRQGSSSRTDVNFTTHVITTSANWAMSVYATDVDGDGDVDVLSASSYDDKIAWYENDGNESFTTDAITTSADGAW